MVSEHQIREEELTSDDVLGRLTEEPQDGVRWLDVWDESEAERPGENTRIEDGTLYWEYEGFEVALESIEVTHWRATVTIPEAVGQHYPREIDLKCSPKPEYGFIEAVETEGYAATEATLVLQENFQPTFEVNNWIDWLTDSADETEAFLDDLEDKLAVAREVEAEQKQARDPGWTEDGELVCPHCKEKSTHIVHQDGGGAECVHCGGSVDDYVEEPDGE